MESYKGYLIDGRPLVVHPFSPDWYVGGTVLRAGRLGSIIEVGRVELPGFTVGIKGLAW